MPQISEDELFHYQKACLRDLELNFKQKDRQRGLVSIPTGGGKTIITVKFVLKEYVERGHKVLWLCNRSELLKQAKNDFIMNKDIIGTTFINDMILISAEESSWAEVKKDDKIIFSTDKSARLNKDHLQLMVKQTEKGIITVIDEAHHSVSPTYLDIINELFRSAKANNIAINLMGLTATPYRMKDNKTQKLMKLYDDMYDIETLESQNGRETFKSIIARAHMNELITQNVLATPKTIDYETEIKIEDNFSEEEIEEMSENGDLTKRALNMIGENKIRNKKIVEEYKDNKDKYGKTIVYATDINHCKTLTREFKEEGIEAEFVTHETSDEDFDNIKEGFKNNGSPEVLVNVLKLTEGFDAPKVKTIFLARPTESEVLFRQMIGRGMRGTRVGGTEEVYLVTFVDSWSNYNPIKSNEVIKSEKRSPRTEILQNDISAPTDDEDRKRETPLSEALLMTAYEKTKEKSSVEINTLYEAFPEAWLCWEKPIYDKKIGGIVKHRDKNMLIYNNQSRYYNALIEAIKENKNYFSKDIDQENISKIFDDIFGECPGPLPTRQEIKELIQAICDENIEIKRYQHEEKEKYDPQKLAKEIYDNDYGRKAEQQRLKEVYENHPGCQIIYKTFDRFRDDVETEIHKLTDKDIDTEIEIPEKKLKKLSSEGHFEKLKLIAEGIIYEKDILPGMKAEMLPSSIYEQLKNEDDEEYGSIPLAIDQYIEEDSFENVNINNEKSILAEFSKPKQNRINTDMFSRGVPEYNDVKFSKREVSYFGTFHNKTGNIIINKKLNSKEIPLFVLEYVIYKQLLDADMRKTFAREKYNERLKNFCPSGVALVEASVKGYENTESIEYYWYAVSSQFLHTLHRIYDIDI